MWVNLVSKALTNPIAHPRVNETENANDIFPNAFKKLKTSKFWFVKGCEYFSTSLII